MNVGELKDIHSYQEEKQTIIDENQVNEAFNPANNIFSGLRELGDWIFDFVSDVITQAIGHFSNS